MPDTFDLDRILAYIDHRIEQYKARDERDASFALGILRGDLVAGLHVPDAPLPLVPDCKHTNEKPVGGGQYGASGFECIDCLRVRLV